MWALDQLQQDFATQPVDLKVPLNSPDEDDMISIGSSESDEKNAANATMGKTQFLIAQQVEKKKFDFSKIEHQPFQMVGISVYPYKAKEG